MVRQLAALALVFHCSSAAVSEQSRLSATTAEAHDPQQKLG